MRTILMAAVAATTLGMTGAGLAKQPIADDGGSRQARNETVLPTQHYENIAGNSAQGSSVVLPSQRPQYLANNGAQGSNSVSSPSPSQRPAYLT